MGVRFLAADMVGFAVVCLVLQGVLAVDVMSPLRDHEIVYVCEGEDLVLPWNLILDPNEELVDIQWRFDGSSKHEMMAMFANDEFLPTRDYNQRIQHVGAGLLMSGMTKQDSGNYTLTVNAHSAGSYLKMTTTVEVQMAEPPVTHGDELKVTQEPVAVYDNATDRWYLTLTCGTFKYLGQPPVQVLWTTPTGQTQISSEYKDGNFILRLPDPVPGGNFTCTIPSSEPGKACLPRSSHLREETIPFPDRQQQLIQQLRQENARLLSEVNKTCAGGVPATGFFAILDPGKQTVGPGDRLMPTHILVNEGQQFNQTTGVFTAPVNGIYFFYGSAVAEIFAGMSNDLIGFGGASTVEYAKTYDSQANLLSSVIWDYKHLKAGDQVYVVSSGAGTLDPYNSGFGGFLMSVD